MTKQSLVYIILQLLFIHVGYSQVGSEQIKTDTLLVYEVTVAKPQYTPIIAFTKGNILSSLSIANTSIDKLEKTEVHSPSMAHTAFFCKLEDKLSKNAKFPIRMRLGDIRYVDVMEGKRKELVPSN